MRVWFMPPILANCLHHFSLWASSECPRRLPKKYNMLFPPQSTKRISSEYRYFRYHSRFTGDKEKELNTTSRQTSLAQMNREELEKEASSLDRRASLPTNMEL